VSRGAQKERCARRENGEPNRPRRSPRSRKSPKAIPGWRRGRARAPGVSLRRGEVPGPRVSAPGPTRWRRGRFRERERGGGAGAFSHRLVRCVAAQVRRCAGHALSPEASSGSC
jgi:hypothetical protein